MTYSRQRISDEAIPAHFWGKVERGPGCWEWRGSRNPQRHNYGQFHVHRRRVIAHRFAYELIYGPIPDGLVVMHSCDNPGCCRPSHLRLGSVAENQQDMISKRRHARGDRASWAQLTNAQVVELRTRFAGRRKLPNGVRAALVAAWGVRGGVITNALHGRTYRLAEVDQVWEAAR